MQNTFLYFLILKFALRLKPYALSLQVDNLLIIRPTELPLPTVPRQKVKHDRFIPLRFKHRK